ncbi:MAG: hypothetical protein QG585_381 [Patescibacteria group bacterium]|jgi:8-oxo-dGTP pyrophosphatase MutT (NUDIX family)|nr:hypothetical protein [Patescibacteria group bacterium]
MEHRSYGIIVFRKKGVDLEFLLVKNKNTDYFGFPKGTPEEEETPEETARREFQEETGLKAPKDFFEETFVEEYDFKGSEGKNIHKINTYFLGEMVIEQRVGEIFDDIEEVLWVLEDHVPATLTFEEGREVYRQVVKTLG